MKWYSGLAMLSKIHNHSTIHDGTSTHKPCPLPSTQRTSPSPSHVPPPIKTYNPILSLRSISACIPKSLSSTSSLVPKTSSHAISASRPARISSCTLPAPPLAAFKQFGRHSPPRTMPSSICRRTGSASPNWRRRSCIFSSSWVLRQFARRDSRGWVDCRVVLWVVVDGEAAGWSWFRRARRVSCTPGAEGAPFSGVVCEGCGAAGVRRRDCGCQRGC